MSLPHLPSDRYVLTIRTFPEGNLQVNFTWHDEACRFLMDQAAMYAGQVTAFRATLAEHTAANGRRILHELTWKAAASGVGLREFVADTLREDLVRQIMETTEEQLRTHAGTTSPVVRAEWHWDGDSDGYCLYDLPDNVRLADGNVFDDVYAVMDTCLYAVSDRFLLTGLLGLSTDQPLVIRRERGAIVTSADAEFVDEPPFKATA